MSDADTPRPALRQLLWIAAGVAVLTLLVVAVSWLFSPRLVPGDALEEHGSSTLKEEQVRKDTFTPETAASPSPLAVTEAQRPPERIPEQRSTPPGPGSTVSASPTTTEPVPPADPKPSPRLPAPSSPPPSAPASKGFAVQVGAFAQEAKAREVASRLKGLGYAATVLAKDGKYKVLAKGFADRAGADKAQAALAKAGIRDPFIVPVE